MNEPHITLPLSALRSLLFHSSGDESYPNITPQSALLGDIAKIVVTHSAIGKLLQTVDPQELYFHVELYDSHAELWLSYEWAESNLRRQKIKDFMVAEMQRHDENKTLIAALEDELSATRDFPESYTKALAHKIAENVGKHDLSALLEVLELQHLFEKKASTESPQEPPSTS